MFDFGDGVITKVFNPLKITKNSIIEFNIGELKGTGIYHFKKMIEFQVDGREYTRYLVNSKSENSEYIFEVLQGENGQLETYLFELTDTVPFSEEFLDVAGQRYMTTPEGDEYERVIMPEEEDRIEGVPGKVKVYDIASNRIEREVEVKLWDYQRDADGTTELLNVEMMEDTGMFRIFRGEMLEEIFYKFYQNAK